jgi:hypothetical protein
MRCKHTERAKRKLSESTKACGLFQLQLGKKMVEKIHALVRRKKRKNEKSKQRPGDVEHCCSCPELKKNRATTW